MTSTSLATRLHNTTNNLIATSVILVVGLALGREVIHGWWQARGGDTEPSAAIDASTNVPPEQFASLGLPFSRASLTGSRDQAVAALHQNCVAAYRQHAHSAAPLGNIEESLLVASTPLGSQGHVDFYLQEEGFPLIVGVAAKETDDTANNRRIVCWGWATSTTNTDTEEPASATSQWTLSVYAAGKPQGE